MKRITNKPAVARREAHLRHELNAASEEVEQQLLRVAGVALAGGLLAYGLYKLISGSDEEDHPAEKPTYEKSMNEYSRSDYKKAHAILERKGNAWYTSSAVRFSKALAPVVLAFVKNAILETEKPHVHDPDTVHIHADDGVSGYRQGPAAAVPDPAAPSDID